MIFIFLWIFFFFHFSHQNIFIDLWHWFKRLIPCVEVVFVPFWANNDIKSHPQLCCFIQLTKGVKVEERKVNNFSWYWKVRNFLSSIFTPFHMSLYGNVNLWASLVRCLCSVGGHHSCLTFKGMSMNLFSGLSFNFMIFCVLYLYKLDITALFWTQPSY